MPSFAFKKTVFPFVFQDADKTEFAQKLPSVYDRYLQHVLLTKLGLARIMQIEE